MHIVDHSVEGNPYELAEDLLSRPLFCFVGLLSTDGQAPRVSPLWFLWEDDALWILGDTDETHTSLWCRDLDSSLPRYTPTTKPRCMSYAFMCRFAFIGVGAPDLSSDDDALLALMQEYTAPAVWDLAVQNGSSRVLAASGGG